MAFLRANKALLLILVVSFLASISYSFYFRIHPVVDAKAYDRIAMNLADGFGFKEDASKSFEFDQAMLRAGPGYEFFLAAIYVVVGHRYEAVWVVQAVLHAVSAFFIFCICRRLFADKGHMIGLVAAGLFAFSPDLIEIGAMLLTETLYLFFTILALYFFILAFERPDSHGRAFMLGLVTGLGVLTRPTLVLFVPVWLVYFAYKRAFFPALLSVTIFALVLLPWTARNYKLYHQIIPTTLIGSYNIWLGNLPTSDGGQFSENINPLAMYVDSEGLSGLKKHASQQFVHFISLYPGKFIVLSALRLVRFFSLMRPMGFWFYQQGAGQLAVVASSAVWIAAVFLGGLAGLLKLIAEKRRVFYYIGALALTAVIPLLPTVVQSRYRFQIYPFFIIAGSFLFVYLFERKIAWWRDKTILFPWLFLGLITIIDGVLNIQKIIGRVGGLL